MLVPYVIQIRIKMRILVFLTILSLTTLSFADEVCVTIDTITWTQGQKNLRQATAYNLAFNVGGQDVVPTVSGDFICFQNPTFDVSTVITGTTLLNKMVQQKADNDAELAQLDTFRNELQTIDSQLETDDTDWNNLTTAQKLIVIKKILRREVLKQKVGGQ